MAAEEAMAEVRREAPSLEALFAERSAPRSYFVCKLCGRSFSGAEASEDH